MNSDDISALERVIAQEEAELSRLTRERRQSIRQLKMKRGYYRWTRIRKPARSQSPVAPNLKWITWRGETKLAGEWADELGIPRATLWARLRNGWSVERALTEKKRAYKTFQSD